MVLSTSLLLALSPPLLAQTPKESVKARAPSSAAKGKPRPFLEPITKVLLLPMVAGQVVGQVAPAANSNHQIADDFAKWTLKKKDAREVGPGEYLRQWYTESSYLLQDVNALALQSEALAGFVYPPGGVWTPLVVGEKNGAPVLVVSSLRGKYEYNTARQRESEIASRVATSIILQIQKTIAGRFRQNLEIEYYGVVVTYSVRNFVVEKETTHYQTLCLISPAKSCARYLDLEISDAQILRESDAYLISGGDLRKIEIAPM